MPVSLASVPIRCCRADPGPRGQMRVAAKHPHVRCRVQPPRVELPWFSLIFDDRWECVTFVGVGDGLGERKQLLQRLRHRRETDLDPGWACRSAVTSDDTIVRRLKKRARPPAVDARVVGVDGWAKRTGLNYGTIVVDLERRTVVDVLDTYDVEAVQHWFAAHPAIHMICRDRNRRYAKAAHGGAPNATQVTDRFHLVQNLRETIERELAVHRAHLRVGHDGPVAPPAPEATSVLDPIVNRPVTARERLLWPAWRLALDTEIARQRATRCRICSTGSRPCRRRPMAVIGRQLGFNRRRLDRWAKVDALPTRSPMPARPRSAEPFRAYLRQRWEAGYRNGRLLFEEIQALGSTGTHKSVNKLVSPWRLGNIAYEHHAPFPRLPTTMSTSLTETPAIPALPSCTRPKGAADFSANRHGRSSPRPKERSSTP